jgi:hypothetical protein
MDEQESNRLNAELVAYQLGELREDVRSLTAAVEKLTERQGGTETRVAEMAVAIKHLRGLGAVASGGLGALSGVAAAFFKSLFHDP